MENGTFKWTSPQIVRTSTSKVFEFLELIQANLTTDQIDRLIQRLEDSRTNSQP